MADYHVEPEVHLLDFGVLLHSDIGVFVVVGQQPADAPHSYAMGCALQLALLPTVLSLFFMTISINLIGSTPSAIMGALEPVTAVCIGVLIFGEAFSLRLGIGILLILAGVVLIILRKRNLEKGKCSDTT